MKTYPLDVIDNGNDMYDAVISKGHHDFDDFMTQAKVRFPTLADSLLKPEHIYYKSVPIYQWYGYVTQWIDVPKGTRGAFPVTFSATIETKHPYQEIEK